MTNRLPRDEPVPVAAQGNPVNRWEWTEEAFAEARRRRDRSR